jgi:hypothetical protein
MVDDKLTSPPPKRRHVRYRNVQVLTEAQLSGMLPLDYMLAVIRDPNATQLRRDKMAIAAAPYCHPRLMPDAPTKGKKDQRAEAAATAGGADTEWSDDLEVNQVN